MSKSPHSSSAFKPEGKGHRTDLPGSKPIPKVKRSIILGKIESKEEGIKATDVTVAMVRSSSCPHISLPHYKILLRKEVGFGS